MSDRLRTNTDSLRIVDYLRDGRHKLCVVGEPCLDCQERTEAADTIESLQAEVEKLRELAIRCVTPNAGTGAGTYTQQMALHDLDAYLRGTYR